MRKCTKWPPRGGAVELRRRAVEADTALAVGRIRRKACIILACFSLRRMKSVPQARPLSTPRLRVASCIHVHVLLVP